jgi:hypothetical protein
MKEEIAADEQAEKDRLHTSTVIEIRPHIAETKQAVDDARLGFVTGFSRRGSGS